MVHPHALIKLYGYNATLINKQTAALTHEESLLQLPFDGNSLNWILGHLVSSRTLPLRLVGQEPVWTEEQRTRYRHGSSTVTADGEGVMRLETVLADFNGSQERLVAGLVQMNYEDMCRPSGYQDNTIGDSLAYFQFHEAHHVGQLMYLAQFAGKPGVWFD